MKEFKSSFYCGIQGSLIGEVTFKKEAFYSRAKKIFVADKLDLSALGYEACITKGEKGAFFYPAHIYHADWSDKLHDGDIIHINNKGEVSVLWELEARDNVLFLTESCNCNCIMCPQPPKKHDKFLIETANNVLDLIKCRDIKSICITGGEPTLLGNAFIKILRRCTQEHPDAHIYILTNAKKFSDRDFARTVVENINNNVVFCISLHSEVDSLHDKIVGVRGSWEKTQNGIYNLAELGVQIEIRHVITKLNYMHLCSFAEHMYNYMPFCVHYAFMGLEVHGNAWKHVDDVYISPNIYKQYLKKAVLDMHRKGLPVSIYNIPLCLCDTQVHRFAKKSISGWKNIFLDQCDSCEAKDRCAGFFSTSSILPLEDIKPLIQH